MVEQLLRVLKHLPRIKASHDFCPFPTFGRLRVLALPPDGEYNEGGAMPAQRNARSSHSNSGLFPEYTPHRRGGLQLGDALR